MHPEEYFQSKGYDGKTDELWKRWLSAKDRYENARLLLGDLFVARFEEIGKDLQAIEDDIPPERARGVAHIFAEASKSLLSMAKAEMALQMPD